MEWREEGVVGGGGGGGGGGGAEVFICLYAVQTVDKLAYRDLLTITYVLPCKLCVTSNM